MSAFKYLRQKFQQEKVVVVKSSSASSSSSSKTAEAKHTFTTSTKKTETKSDGVVKNESKTVVNKLTETKTTPPAWTLLKKSKPKPEPEAKPPSVPVNTKKPTSSDNSQKKPALPPKPEPEVFSKKKSAAPPPVAQKPKKMICETEEKKNAETPAAETPATVKERKSSLSEEKIQELHETFNLFDKNRDGFISKEELGAVLFALGQRPTVIEVQNFIRSVDIDKSGTIDFDEFVTIFSAKMCLDPESELHEVFRCFDKNSDGFICSEELYSMLQKLGEPITKAEAQKMIHEADTNRDGKVDYSEFKAILTAR